MGMLRRHLVLAVLLFVLISGAGVAYSLFMWLKYPTYQSTVLIQIEAGQGAIGAAEIPSVEQPIQSTLLEQFINDQIGSIRQPSTLRKALDPRAATEFSSQLLYANRERTLQLDSDIDKRTQYIAQEAPAMLEAEGPEEMTAELDNRLSVGSPFRSTRITISLAGEDAQLITDLVNAVADSYMLAYKADRASRQNRRMQGLETQFSNIKNQLAIKTGEIAAFKRDNPAIRVTAGLTDIQQQLELFQRARTEAQLELFQRGLEKAVIDQPIEEQKATPDMVLAIETDPLLSNYQAALSSLIRDREQLLTRFSPEYKAVQDTESRIATTKAMVESRRQQLEKTLIARRSEELLARFDAAEKRFQQIDQQYTEAARKATQYEQASINYDQKMEEAKQLQSDVQDVQSAKTRLQIIIDASASNVSIAQPGTVPAPSDKYGPKLQFYIPGSILLGFIISVVMVLMVELIDNRVRTPQQVQRLVQIPVLGNIPDRKEDPHTAAVSQLSRVALEAPQSLMAESFRELRTALLYSTDTDLKTLLITSGRAGVGKTVIAANLAITLAQGGSHVLVIDANFRRPLVHRVFDLPNTVGLSSVLARLNSFDEAVHTSSVANLDVLTCGPLPPSPGDLLGSEAMQNLLTEVRGRYDAVVIDGPPILVVSDANVLCSMVDGTVLVVSAASTPRGVAIRATRTLRSLKARVVGAVLNRVRATKGGYFREQYKSYYAYAGTSGDDTAAPATKAS